MIQERYNMTKDQPAQIDCRKSECKFNNGGGNCSNISPAITLNEKKNNCWSYEERKFVYLVFLKDKSLLVGCFDTEQKANQYSNDSPNTIVVKTMIY